MPPQHAQSVQDEQALPDHKSAAQEPPLPTLQQWNRLGFRLSDLSRALSVLRKGVHLFMPVHAGQLRASQHLRLCSLVTAECAVLREACIPPAPPPSRPSQGALQRVVWEECKSQREEESCNTCSSRQDAAAALMSSQLPGNNRPKRREELPEKL